jgi:hypothetical protein
MNPPPQKKIGSKEEPNIVLTRKSKRTSQHGTKDVNTRITQMH